MSSRPALPTREDPVSNKKKSKQEQTCQFTKILLNGAVLKQENYTICKICFRESNGTRVADQMCREVHFGLVCVARNACL